MNTKELLAYDSKHIIHPYTSPTRPLPCFLVESANGVMLKLSDGRTLIDGMSSWWAVIHGYNNPYMNKAIEKQLSKMSHIMFGGITHEPAIKLAKRLVELTPQGLEHVFYSDSGSVAVEVALKMALQYWYSLEQPQKCKFATIKSGYHGDTWHPMSVCDPVTGMHHIFNQTLASQYFVPQPRTQFYEDWDEDDLKEVAQLFEEKHQELAAFILEPIVQGAGGMRFYHPNYLKGIRTLCDKYNILLIADEIATGFGRTGKMFACEWANISPDIMCIGKALTSGYITFAATLTTHHVATVISEGYPGVFMHGPTFMGNPLACSAANASLDLIEQNDILTKVASIEKQLKQDLVPLKEVAGVTDVQVLGAIGAVYVEEDVDMERLQQLFVDHGIWIRPFGKLIYAMPPYVITPSELSELTTQFCKTIKTYLA